MLYVSSIAPAFQRDGLHAGTPAVFIRLQGCRCRCPWCETANLWEMPHRNDVPLRKIAERPDGLTWATCTDAELAAFVLAAFPDVRHVVFTGGEPLLQPIATACRTLIQEGRTVQVETSGTCRPDLPPDVWLTVSPKFAMPGGQKVYAEALRRANEILMPVAAPKDLETLSEELEGVDRRKIVFLSPVDMTRENTELCRPTALRKGWRLNLRSSFPQ